MAMRSQIYAWDLYGEGTAPSGPVGQLQELTIKNPGTLYTAFTTYLLQKHLQEHGSGLKFKLLSVGGGGEVVSTELLVATISHWRQV